MDLGLKDRVAIVAASSTGLGKAVAMGLAREGAKVALCARTEGTLNATAEEIHRETGVETLARALDVTETEDTRPRRCDVRLVGTMRNRAAAGEEGSAVLIIRALPSPVFTSLSTRPNGELPFPHLLWRRSLRPFGNGSPDAFSRLYRPPIHLPFHFRSILVRLREAISPPILASLFPEFPPSSPSRHRPGGRVKRSVWLRS